MRILLFILLIFTSTMVTAQDNEKDRCTDPACRTIIATGGVNLRSAPQASARKIAAAPFGAKVSVLDEMASDSLKIGDLEGCWQQVRYGEQEGFMFSPFLSRNFYPIDQHEEIHLFSDNSSCQNNLRFNPNFTYYAVVKLETDLFQMKPVKVSFHVSANPIFAKEAEILNFDFEGAENPVVVVGQKKWGPIPETIQGIGGRDAMLYLGNPDFERREEAHTTVLPGFPEYEIHYTVEADHKGGFRFPHLSLQNTQSGIHQVISGKGTDNYFRDLLLWAGDMDGDGHPDFVIEDDKSHGYLYLSSAAQKGELLRRVARYFGGYCC